MKKEILSFGTHPDDIEIGCGATEAKLIEQGYEATHVYVTSGESGSQSIPKEKLRKIRENEANEAAKILGVKEVKFIRAADGLNTYTREMKIELINMIRKIQPDIVFIHATNDAFPDHKIVNGLVLGALCGAAGPWYQETKGEPWSPKMVLGYEVWHPLSDYQMVVNVSDTIDQKMTALACYKSQLETTRYDEAFKGLARYRGVMSCEGKYAEVFEVIKITNIS